VYEADDFLCDLNTYHRALQSDALWEGIVKGDEGIRGDLACCTVFGEDGTEEEHPDV
jgi:hypothetical protein